MKLKTAFLALGLILFSTLGSKTYALELSISGNGDSSESEVNLTSTATTTITQENNAQINNQVTVQANSGENTASANTSDTTITTGDISTQISIENNANLSTVSLDCCPQPQSSITITDSGSASQNSVDFNQNSDTQINVYQNAYIQNSISGSASSGGNSANNNSGGNVSITTGNIYANLSVENKNINLTTVFAPQANGSLDIKIAGNGSFSKNGVSLFLNNNLNINIASQTEIINSAIWDLITGRNQASGNTGGNVYIATGDINLVAEITNDSINTNQVSIDCCTSQGRPDDPGDQEDQDDDDDTGGSTLPPPDSTLPTSPSSPPSTSSSPSGGEVLGVALAAAGQILPATGSVLTLMLTLVSLLMFILGLYLRFHPGLDPGLKLNFINSA